MSAILQFDSDEDLERIESVSNHGSANSILGRIAAGDATAVEDCVKQYGGLIWTLARRLSTNYAEAEDAVQEIFIEIWQAAGSFDERVASESTFVTMIARRKLIDRYRRNRRGLEVAAVDLADAEFARFPDASEVELQDEAAKAAGCFKKLTENTQKVLRLAIHHDRSHAEIAATLSLPLGTVKSFARRGLLQLRECMQRRLSPLQEGVA